MGWSREMRLALSLADQLADSQLCSLTRNIGNTPQLMLAQYVGSISSVFDLTSFGSTGLVGLTNFFNLRSPPPATTLY